MIILILKPFQCQKKKNVYSWCVVFIHILHMLCIYTCMQIANSSHFSAIDYLIFVEGFSWISLIFIKSFVLFEKETPNKRHDTFEKILKVLFYFLIFFSYASLHHNKLPSFFLVVRDHLNRKIRGKTKKKKAKYKYYKMRNIQNIRKHSRRSQQTVWDGFYIYYIFQFMSFVRIK